MDPAVVVPLLVEKIAQSKRKQAATHPHPAPPAPPHRPLHLPHRTSYISATPSHLTPPAPIRGLVPSRRRAAADLLGSQIIGWWYWHAMLNIGLCVCGGGGKV